MPGLDSIGPSRRSPTPFIGAGLVIAGATLAAIGALAVFGGAPTPTVAFAAAAALSLAVLLAGVGLGLGGSPTRDHAVSWERSTPGPHRATDGGEREPRRR